MSNIEIEEKVNKIARVLVGEKGYLCMIDVLLKLEYLSKKDLEDWRFGRIHFLEKVCHVNLTKLSRIQKMMRSAAREMQLKPSWTAYNKYGKGSKIRLRFSKSGTQYVEDAYSTHYVNMCGREEKKVKKVKEKKEKIPGYPESTAI